MGAGSGTAAASGELGAEAEQSWWQSPAVGWTFLGLGVASGVASGIAFATREDRVDRWNDDRCIPQREPDQTRETGCGQFKDQAETAQTIGIVTAVAGVVFSGVGITQLLTSGGSGDTVAEDTASASPGFKVSDCGAGFLTIACRGSF
jgi:hypothetical protein